MTRVAERRTKLAGESNAVVQGRTLMVVVEPHSITVRPKGKRFAVSVPIIAVWELGCRVMANEKRREKLAARRNGRKEPKVIKARVMRPKCEVCGKPFTPCTIGEASLDDACAQLVSETMDEFDLIRDEAIGRLWAGARKQRIFT